MEEKIHLEKILGQNVDFIFFETFQRVQSFGTDTLGGVTLKERVGQPDQRDIQVELTQIVRLHEMFRVAMEDLDRIIKGHGWDAHVLYSGAPDNVAIDWQ